MLKVQLHKSSRLAEIELPVLTTKLSFTPSREKCNDILVELVNDKGNATSKPLHKLLNGIKLKDPVVKVRFLMNDFCTKSIAIEVKVN